MSKKLAEKKHEKEVYDLFSKVEVNIPLLELVKKSPHMLNILRTFVPIKENLGQMKRSK